MLTGSRRTAIPAALATLTLLVVGRASPADWPSFRGPRASGIADGQNAPLAWNAEKGVNIRWKTKIPGLGHSSPIVWGERVFITSAVSSDPDPYLRPGLYGESPDHPEREVHNYRVYCLEKSTGKILWEKTAHSGVPQVKRHIKSSHANSTPATDGKHIVTFFGSEGLYCYDMDGKLLWRQDLGYLDAGAFDAPEIQWGFGSSPIIYANKVIVLCDVNNQSFLAAFDVESGKELWRTPREEVPTWGTPTVCTRGGRTQVVVNGWKHIGGYDIETGEELWRLRGGGDIPVPTPVIAHGLVFITNAHGSMSPIYAIRLDARGDISLADGEQSNEFVAWSYPRRGAYIPTPIVYGDYLYVGSDRGVLTCYEAKTGRQVYRERIAGRRGAYSASAVAADGKLYFTSEDGDIHVIKAGPEYEHLATNPMGGICLATPAIAGQMMFVRTSKHLYGIGETRDEGAARGQARPADKVAQKAGSEEQGVSGDQSARTGSEPTDPVEILKRVDAAAKAVKTAKYDVVVEGTGAAKARVGSLKATVVATGFAEGFPEKFVVRGEATLPGSAETVRFTGGSDGNEYYLIDHATKTVRADLELSVMGSFLRAVLGGIVREFHHPTPFSDEVNGKEHELRGSKPIGGEECWEIRVVYATESGGEVTWYIAKKDFLPRRRQDSFTMPDGEQGGMSSTLTNLVVEPRLAPDAFKLKVPEGYTKTDQPAP